MTENAYIEEKVISFENEPEAQKFLGREFVFGIGGIDCELVDVTKHTQKSKAGKDYETYTLKVKTEMDEYTVSNVFRGDLHWRKRPMPKKIKISVVKQNEFFNWKITALD